MQISFLKYQGTGNDFIIINDLENNYHLSNHQIQFLCDRHFGIGADGLIIIRKNQDLDFEMIYYNSDGEISSMCGNGGRCAVAYAYSIGIINGETTFLAPDGKHDARVLSNKGNITEVALQMKDIAQVESFVNDFVLDTGSPHYVRFVEDVANTDVVKTGREIRYSESFAEQGINVNFVQIQNEGDIFVRTYERGVEDETLSCGTGVTASALVASGVFKTNLKKINIKTLGGDLKVSFEKTINDFSNIWLEGPATFVFGGEIDL